MNLQVILLLLLLLFIHYLQLGRHPVAGVFTCYISTDYDDFPLKFRYGVLHGKHVRSGNLEMSGTIPAFAQGPRETKKTLCRDGRSQDLPGTDF